MTCHVVNFKNQRKSNCSALLIKDFDAWIPSYLFTHVILIIIALWAAQDQKNLESILAYIVAVAITILNDMILLGIYFSDSQEIAGDDYLIRY